MKILNRKLAALLLCLMLTIGVFPTSYAVASSGDDPVPEFVPGIIPVETDCVYPTYKTGNLSAIKRFDLNAKSLPSSYDAREEGYTTPVKNQGKNGLCWVFANVGALEASMVKDGVISSTSSVDLSESHVAYATCTAGGNNAQGFRDKPSDGGNRYWAAAYLMRGTDGLFGTVDESDDPYSTAELKERALHVTKEKPKSYTVQNIVYVTGKGKATAADQVDAIKQAVMGHGAVSAVMHYEDASYREKTCAYYYAGASEDANHAVVIVGWDDAYPRGNFKANPGSDGAWLVRNSWGKNWGDKGYFWISYADSRFPQVCTYYDGVKEYDNSLTVYETDYKCAGGGLGYVDDSMYCARVFQAEGDESLQSVRVFIPGSNAEVSVDCIPNFQYRDSKYGNWYQFDGYSDFSTKGSIHISYPGWYTIDLDTPVKLTKGKDFAVIICVQNDFAGSVAYIGTDSKNALGDSLVFVSNGSNFNRYHDWSKSSSNFAIKAVTKPTSMLHGVSYTVTWKNWDGTVLEIDKNVKVGTMPTYNGATPARAATAQYTYEFDKWSPAIAPVMLSDAIYTATYKATAKSSKVAVDTSQTYYIESALGNVLDVEGISCAAGANSYTWTFHGGDNQKWVLEDAGDGYYFIKSGMGTYLDVSGSSKASGTNVLMWTLHRGDNQKWALELADDGYYYIRSALGTYLDVDHSGTVCGTNVWAYTGNRTAAQKWKLRPAVNTGQAYYIESALGNVLDVAGISSAAGANSYTWTFHGGDNQKWILEDAGDGYYFIKSGMGTYLDVSGSSKASGTNVLMWTLHRGDNQKWALELADDGYYYIRSALGTYLDVDGAGTACGTNVWAYTGNQTAAQKWKLVS